MCYTFSCVPSPGGLRSRRAVWQAKPDAQPRHEQMTDPIENQRRRQFTRTVRMNEQEVERFKQFCETVDLTPSEALRRLARSAALLGPTFAGEARAEVTELTRQMRAIGNNLNQTVHLMNAGHIIQGDDLKRHLDEVHGAIGELDRLYSSLCVRSHKRARAAILERPA